MYILEEWVLFSLFKKKQVYANIIILLVFHGLRRITFSGLDAHLLFLKIKVYYQKITNRFFVLISYISFLKKIDLIYMLQLF